MQGGQSSDEEQWGSALSLHGLWALPDCSGQREKMDVGRGP